MLHVKSTHTKGDEFKVELVNPQAPNGRPLSQVFVASFSDLIAIRDMVDLVMKGYKTASIIANNDHTLPAEFRE